MMTRGGRWQVLRLGAVAACLCTLAAPSLIKAAASGKDLVTTTPENEKFQEQFRLKDRFVDESMATRRHRLHVLANRYGSDPAPFHVPLSESVPLTIHFRTDVIDDQPVDSVRFKIDEGSWVRASPVTSSAIRWNTVVIAQAPTGQRNLRVRAEADTPHSYQPFLGSFLHLAGESFVPIFLGQQPEERYYRLVIESSGWIGGGLYVRFDEVKPLSPEEIEAAK